MATETGEIAIAAARLSSPVSTSTYFFINLIWNYRGVREVYEISTDILVLVN
jgi:hypothetical protein